MMMLPTFGPLLLLLLFFFLIFTTTPAAPSSSLSVTVGVTDNDTDTVPVPSAWPFQFHSLLFVNTSSFTLQAIDLWYDWPNSRNFNIIHKQLKNTLYDLEWSNGTSFYYDLDAQTCFTLHFDVGILRPDWMVDNSTYLGQQVVDGFTCNVWTKADFIVYYEDVETNRPVHWVFYTGTSVHVMTFEVGAVLEDSEWQAPAYCFDGQENSTTTSAANPLTMNAGNEEKQLQRWHYSLQASLHDDTFFNVKNELNLYTK